MIGFLIGSVLGVVAGYYLAILGIVLSARVGGVQKIFREAGFPNGLGDADEYKAGGTSSGDEPDDPPPVF